MGDRLGDKNKSVVLIGLLENFLQCISKFCYTFDANNVSSANHKYGSNEDSEGRKTDIWPFLTFNVAFGKFSFWWLIKHKNRHFFHFGQNVVNPSCLAKSGWTVC